jgi:2-aminoadipate transaminase
MLDHLVNAELDSRYNEWRAFLSLFPPHPGDASSMSTAVNPVSLDALLSHRGKLAPSAGMSDPRHSAGYISFIYGFPDAATLPNQTVLAATAQALAADPEWALQYGKTTGEARLISVLLDKIKRDQGIRADHDNMMLTAGSSQAIQLLLDLLVDPGDVVIAEAPTFLGFIDTVAVAGAEIIGVPVDQEGIDVGAVERSLTELRERGVTPKFIYCISNFQNPSGNSTTVERRKRLIALAQEFGTLVVEDDAYHDLRFSGERIPPIYALDDSGSTIYLGTLSKIMGPGMRIGWMVAAPAIIAKLAGLKSDGGTNIFGAHVAAAWIPEHLDTHIETLNDIYSTRRDLMLAALDEHMPEGATWTRPDGGFFIWVTLPESIDTGQMLAQARERGVEYLPGVTCFTGGLGANMLRLSFSFAKDDQINEGIRLLADVVRSEMLEAAR